MRLHLPSIALGFTVAMTMALGCVMAGAQTYYRIDSVGPQSDHNLIPLPDYPIYRMLDERSFMLTGAMGPDGKAHAFRTDADGNVYAVCIQGAWP